MTVLWARIARPDRNGLNPVIRPYKHTSKPTKLAALVFLCLIAAMPVKVFAQSKDSSPIPAPADIERAVKSGQDYIGDSALFVDCGLRVLELANASKTAIELLKKQQYAFDRVGKVLILMDLAAKANAGNNAAFVQGAGAAVIDEAFCRFRPDLCLPWMMGKRIGDLINEESRSLDINGRSINDVLTDAYFERWPGRVYESMLANLENRRLPEDMLRESEQAEVRIAKLRRTMEDARMCKASKQADNAVDEILKGYVDGKAVKLPPSGALEQSALDAKNELNRGLAAADKNPSPGAALPNTPIPKATPTAPSGQPMTRSRGLPITECKPGSDGKNVCKIIGYQ
ncbi:MAG: hypothetical protein V4792_05235 [Pseudomonadota bacterium]